MAIDSGSAKMLYAKLRRFVGNLSISGSFFGFQRFRDSFNLLRRYLRTPAGRRHENGTGL